MINGALYRRGMKGSVKLLLILAAVLAMYVVIIVSMYEPEMAKLLDSYVELMPEIMAAVGMILWMLQSKRSMARRACTRCTAPPRCFQHRWPAGTKRCWI